MSTARSVSTRSVLLGLLATLLLAGGASADTVVQNGPFTVSSTWGGAVPDNVVATSTDHLFLNSWRRLTVTSQDGALNYDQLDFTVGFGGTSAWLDMTGGSLTVARGFWGGADGASGSATFSLSASRLEVLGDVVTSHGSNVNTQITLGDGATLRIGGTLFTNDGGGSASTLFTLTGTSTLDLAGAPVVTGGTTASISLADGARLLVAGDHTQDPTLGGLVTTNQPPPIVAAFDGSRTAISLPLFLSPHADLSFPLPPAGPQDEVRLTLTNQADFPIEVTDLVFTPTPSTTASMSLTASTTQPVTAPFTLAAGEAATLLFRVGTGSTYGQIDISASSTRTGLFSLKTLDVTGSRPMSNGIYDVFHADFVHGDPGTYTVMTGPQHPYTQDAGKRGNVIYGDGSPGTSFDTLRSYRTGIDYVMYDSVPSDADPQTTVAIGERGIVTQVDDGSEIGYDVVFQVVDGPGGAPTSTPTDQFTITRKIRIRGGTFADSHVDVTTLIRNDGAEPLPLGLRYQWDYEIIDDDGPTFEAFRPDGSILWDETSFLSPSMAFYGIADREQPGDKPTFYVFGTVNAPALQPEPPTPPDEVHFVAWSPVNDTAFIYVQTGLDIATDDDYGEEDSAVTYYWGATSTTARIVQPGETLKLSQSLFAALADPDTGEPDLPPDVVGSPEIQVTPLTLAFGQQVEGDIAERTIQISNPGTGVLTVSELTFDDPTFSTSAALPLQVPAGGSVTVPILFSASTSSATTTALHVVSDTLDSVIVDLTVTGEVLTATSAQLVASPTPLDFGSLALNGTAIRELKIENPGSGTLTVTQALTDDARFSAVTPLPWVVAPGESLDVQVRFLADAAGAAVAILTLSSTASGQLQTPVTLVGVAVTADSAITGSGCAFDRAAPPASALAWLALLAVGLAWRRRRQRRA